MGRRRVKRGMGRSRLGVVLCVVLVCCSCLPLVRCRCVVWCRGVSVSCSRLVVLSRLVSRCASSSSFTSSSPRLLFLHSFIRPSHLTGREGKTVFGHPHRCTTTDYRLPTTDRAFLSLVFFFVSLFSHLRLGRTRFYPARRRRREKRLLVLCHDARGRLQKRSLVLCHDSRGRLQRKYL